MIFRELRTSGRVGSGGWFGETQTWKTSETKSVACCEMTRRVFTSVGLLGSMTAGLRDRKARLFSRPETEPENFLIAAHVRRQALYISQLISSRSHAWPNVQDEPRPWLARLVLLGARDVTAMVVGSSALLGFIFVLDRLGNQWVACRSRCARAFPCNVDTTK